MGPISGPRAVGGSTTSRCTMLGLLRARPGRPDGERSRVAPTLLDLTRMVCDSTSVNGLTLALRVLPSSYGGRKTAPDVAAGAGHAGRGEPRGVDRWRGRRD